MAKAGAAEGKKMSARAIARAVRELILSRELHPGDRLREVELAERFGVSRGRIREALTALESAGVVRIEHRRGATILRLSDQETRDAQHLATLLMTFAVDRATDRATREERAQLVAAAQALQAADAQSSSYGYLHALGEVNRLIASACHNPYVGRLIDLVVLSGPSAMHAPSGVTSSRRRRQAAADWLRLAELIAGGDGKGATAQLRKIHKASLAAMGVQA